MSEDLEARIISRLKEEPCTSLELRKDLGESYRAVESALQRLRKTGRIVHEERKWWMLRSAPSSRGPKAAS